MSNINWAFWPGWNDAMGRKDFIFNNILLCMAWTAGTIVFAGFAASEPPAVLIFSLVLVMSVFYTILLSVVWVNNRLRDGGLASEGWRIAIIILSFLSGIVGFVAFIYCLVKPTENPRELTVEDDNECRDEGPR